MTTFAVETRRTAATPSTSCPRRPDSPSHSTHASAAAQVRSTWATACAYSIVYGVAFAFLMGPAGTMLKGLGSVAQLQSARFSMVLVAALVVAVGSLFLTFGLGHLVDASARRRGHSAARADAAFRIGAVIFAVLAAAGFAAAASVVLGGYDPAIGWAAALGVLVPGGLAGITARMTGPQLARRTRDLVAGSLAATGVVLIAVYVAMGVASGTADIATIAGATVLP